MRPIYENNFNRSKEQQVVDLLEDKWRATIYKMPSLCVVDRLVVSGGKVKGWLEIKCRTNAFDAYPTYMISSRKVQGGLDLAKSSNLPFILVVSWNGDVRWIKVDQMYPQRSGGRRDRGDSQDIETVCDIPLDMGWIKVI